MDGSCSKNSDVTICNATEQNFSQYYNDAIVAYTVLSFLICKIGSNHVLHTIQV